MSLAGGQGYDAPDLGLEGLDGNTSLLLTGDDSDALEAAFYRLVAPGEDERSVLLLTEARASAAKRALSGVRPGTEERTMILATEGSDYDDAVTKVDDIGDLTGLGMQLSTLTTEAVQDVDQFRTGIFLCSTIMSEVDDTRSVYRFLNSNFIGELRRSSGLGVCALDTSADIGADLDSTIAGLETSFTARVDVESTGRKEATLDVGALSGASETVDISW